MPSQAHSVSIDEQSPLLKTRESNLSLKQGYDTDSDESVDSIEEEKAAIYSLPTVLSEIKVIARSSVSLTFAYTLQYALTLVIMMEVGRFSALDIAATTLGIMTSNVTGISIYEGLAAGIDTLCAQAYGAGRPRMVGVHVQRMIHLMTLCNIPITLAWLFSSHWLGYLVSDPELIARTSHVMAILAIGTPGYYLFEAGRRFVQAQDLIDAPLYVMLAALPTHIFFSWLFVHRFGWGVSGAVLALSVTRNLFPVFLIIYVMFVQPSSLQCWGGIVPFAPRTWHRMVRLAIPGVCIVESEIFNLQFWMITATYFSVEEAAAQSILTTLSLIIAHVPLATGIVVATRLGNLVGSEALHAARLTMKTSVALSAIAGLVDGLLLFLFQEPMIRLFTNDPVVASFIRRAIPILCIYQVFEHPTGVINGMLRGLGKQGRGAWISFTLFLIIGVPAGLGLGFGSLHLRLSGLWIGATIAYFVISIIAGIYGLTTDLEKVVDRIRDME